MFKLCVFAATIALATASYAGYSFTVIPPNQWGAPDATLGVTGYVIEDFEDVNLVSGLAVEVQSLNGNMGPTSTLPNTFMPSQDIFGTAFAFGGGGVWDGERGLINTRTNQTFSYGDTNSWGDTVFHFANPASSVGVSLQQIELNGQVWIDGNVVTTFAALGFTFNGTRQGYLRIDAFGGDTISTLEFDNGSSGGGFGMGDGIMFDHLAFNPVPEPATMIVLGGLAAAALRGRKR